MVLWILIAGIAAADLLIKNRIHQNMKINEKRPYRWKKVCLWHIKNKGVAYNRLEDCQPAILFTSSIAITYFLYEMAKEWKNKGFSIYGVSMALLIGGAIGNFLERIKKGYVTDYIYIKAKGAPIFNMADVFILLGMVIFTLSSVFKKEKL